VQTLIDRRTAPTATLNLTAPAATVPGRDAEHKPAPAPTQGRENGRKRFLTALLRGLSVWAV
jgi:hypothetical protein